MFKRVFFISLFLYAPSFIGFSNKVHELLALKAFFDTKEEIKLLLKISKEGILSLEDAQANNVSIQQSFEKKMQKVYDWIATENAQGNRLQPALNIYNEEGDYYLEFSNFSFFQF
ncbi:MULTISPECIES: hypothetical protein [Flavobacterium]|uniref:Uncharacterized protein n=1 Tax=Flavobacterium jumunjinense TaxID=998845 RepID=A0ABV5GS02_9FLAO|nr:MULTISPECIES: hypothetical protein [Flavobacterium]